MVEAAQQDQVVEAGAATVDPVADMVRMNEAAVRAHREAAAAIAQPESASNRRRHGARLAPDVQHRAAFVRRHRNQRAVATHPAERLRGNARAVVEERLARTVRAEHRLIQMNDDLMQVMVAGGVVAIG